MLPVFGRHSPNGHTRHGYISGGPACSSYACSGQSPPMPIDRNQQIPQDLSRQSGPVFSSPAARRRVLISPGDQPLAHIDAQLRQRQSLLVRHGSPARRTRRRAALPILIFRGTRQTNLLDNVQHLIRQHLSPNRPGPDQRRLKRPALRHPARDNIHVRQSRVAADRRQGLPGSQPPGNILNHPAASPHRIHDPEALHRQGHRHPMGPAPGIKNARDGVTAAGADFEYRFLYLSRAGVSSGFSFLWVGPCQEVESLYFQNFVRPIKPD